MNKDHYSVFLTFYKDVFKYQFFTRWDILDVDMIFRKQSLERVIFFFI